MNVEVLDVVDRLVERGDDFDTAAVVAAERARPRGRTPKINALTREEMAAGKKPPVTFDKLFREAGVRPPRREVPAEDESVQVSPVDAEPFDPGDDEFDPGPKAAPAVVDGRVEDLVADGHGFNVWRYASNPALPEVCAAPGCSNRLIPASEEWPCEFAAAEPVEPVAHRVDVDGMPVRFVVFGEASDRPGASSYRPIVASSVPTETPRLGPGGPMTGRCECNGCTRARLGDRRPGGQPRYCGAPACRKALKDAENERARERQRRAARLVLEQQPGLSDREVADLAGIRILKRVREARQQLAEVV